MTHAGPSSDFNNNEEENENTEFREDDIDTEEITLDGDEDIAATQSKNKKLKKRGGKIATRFIVGGAIIAISIFAILISGMFSSSMEIVTISTSASKSVNNGKLVHAVAPVSSEKFNDPMFSIEAEGIYLERIVEMYQWVEKNGDYTKEWQKELVDIASIEANSKGIINPPEMPFFSEKWQVDEVKIGNFSISPGLLKDLDKPKEITITQNDFEKLNKHGQLAFKLHDGKYFFGIDPNEPRVGDLLVSFKVLNPGVITILAKQSGASFSEYRTENGMIAKILPGEYSVNAMKQGVELEENNLISWIIRVVATLSTLIGIATILGKFSKKTAEENNIVEEANEELYSNEFDENTPQNDLDAVEETEQNILANEPEENHFQSETEINDDLKDNTQQDYNGNKFSTPLDFESSDSSNEAPNDDDYKSQQENSQPPEFLDGNTIEEFENNSPEFDGSEELPEGIEIISDDNIEDEQNDEPAEEEQSDEPIEVVDFSDSETNIEAPHIPLEADEYAPPPPLQMDDDDEDIQNDSIDTDSLDDEELPEGIEIISDDENNKEEEASAQEDYESVNNSHLVGQPQYTPDKTLPEPLEFEQNSEFEQNEQYEEAQEENTPLYDSESNDSSNFPEPLEFNSDTENSDTEDDNSDMSEDIQTEDESQTQKYPAVPTLPRPPLLDDENEETSQEDEGSAEQILAEASSFIDYNEDSNNEETNEEEETKANFDITTEESEDSPFDLPNIPDDFDPNIDMTDFVQDNEEIEFNPDDLEPFEIESNEDQITTTKEDEEENKNG